MPGGKNGNAVVEKKPFQRLPTNVRAKNYNLTLRPNLQKWSFTGEQVVEIEISQETDRVILNALDLDIKEANYKSAKGEALTSTGIELNKDEETATITFPSALKPGTGALHMVFNGTLNDKMKGFYRSKYLVGDEERFAAVTQFESTDARRAFPCWDEPALKATFDITLEVPKNRVALSNMNVISETTSSTDESAKVLKFATTPVMSTYLVAVVVGEFDYVEDTSADGVAVRVYTPVGKKEQGLFALEVATKALPYYKEYFDIAYPLPKMDLIAIADFAAGAMENWGLVTYRETCLLVDPKNTSTDRKQWIAIVVGHELAHQWFGNLVTMQWWTELWLNEGYASFVEYLCVDKLFPHYNIWTQFVTQTHLHALELDGLHNSHAIEIPVGHPSEIDEIFDDISYSKGASVIRMLHRYLGDHDFKKGMRLYLNRHQFKNTVTEDLWAALEAGSSKPVGQVMTTWTKQKGFPVITVSQKQDGDNRILTVSQEKFCSDGKLPDSEKDTIWMVPLTISTAASPDKAVVETLLTSKSSDIIVPNVPAGDWVKLNSGTVGVYRVQYSSEMLAELLPAIINKTLSPLDRLGLQSDQFALVQAGRVPTSDILKLINSFVNEDDYTVWSSISAALGKIDVLLSYTDMSEAYHVFGRRLLAKIHAKVGWEPSRDESHTDTLLRSLVIGRLSSFEDPEVLSEARRRFDAHVNGTLVIPADVRSVVYRAVARSGDDKTFESLFKLYREADLHEEKDRISRALGAVKDKSRILKVLEFAMSDEVRSQDTVFVIISTASTKLGRELAWSFFQENKEQFKTRYEGGFLISRLVKHVTENFASEDRAQEVESFFASNVFPGTERTVQQSLETIRLNSEWLARDGLGIRDYLAKTVV